jgi:hypothetical protein
MIVAAQISVLAFIIGFVYNYSGAAYCVFLLAGVNVASGIFFWTSQ